jgi:hypothetical protein
MVDDYFKISQKIENKNKEIEKDFESIRKGLKGEMDKLRDENRKAIRGFQNTKNKFYEFIKSKILFKN